MSSQFGAGDYVRIVTTDTPFFGWTGRIVSNAERFELGATHYFVQMNEWFIEMPLLFREMQLALSLKPEEKEQ